MDAFIFHYPSVKYLKAVPGSFCSSSAMRASRQISFWNTSRGISFAYDRNLGFRCKRDVFRGYTCTCTRVQGKCNLLGSIHLISEGVGEGFRTIYLLLLFKLFIPKIAWKQSIFLVPTNSILQNF